MTGIFRAVTRKAFSRIAGLALAAIALGTVAATAQDAGQEAPLEPTIVEQHGAWVFECTPAEGTEFCTIQQVLSNADTKEVLLHVTIAYHPRTADLLMVSMTPLGVELPLGLGMRIDEGQQMAAPYTNCTRPGCRATAPLNDALVSSLKNGNTMTISYGYRGQRLDAPVSLSGFTAAFDRLASRKPVATAPAATAQ
ncbi:invasion associated locus B family protein [Pyruvatibacter sp.]|uniref:invasion associated locus B family protein n=1 Tax=Pyruvatibacter sp. TaxID=1981328 RepID=UPI0032EDC936